MFFMFKLTKKIISSKFSSTNNTKSHMSHTTGHIMSLNFDDRLKLINLIRIALVIIIVWYKLNENIHNLCEKFNLNQHIDKYFHMHYEMHCKRRKIHGLQAR